MDTTERLHFHFSLSCIGEGNGNPLHCSCLENPRDGGSWWAAVYGVAQSWTRLKRLSSSSSMLVSTPLVPAVCLPQPRSASLDVATALEPCTFVASLPHSLIEHLLDTRHCARNFQVQNKQKRNNLHIKWIMKRWLKKLLWAHRKRKRSVHGKTVNFHVGSSILE